MLHNLNAHLRMFISWPYYVPVLELLDYAHVCSILNNFKIEAVLMPLTIIMKF